MTGAFKNILVIRQSALGDVVNTFPILKALRDNYPEAEITCLTGELTAKLVAGDTCVDRVISFNRTKSFGKLLSMLFRLKGLKFDLVVDLQSSRHSRWLARATAARVRLGHGSGCFYNHAAEYDASAAPACVSFSKILAPLGIEDREIAPRFPNLEQCVAEARLFLEREDASAKPFVVLNPGHSPEWLTKRWPLEHWVAFAQKVISAGYTPLVTGGPAEANVAEKIKALTQGRAIASAGKTSLTELAGLMALSRAVVSTDSGPMHVAAMAGASVVALFGPTNPVPSAPLGAKHRVLHRKLHCSLCFKKQCPYEHECLDELMPETVWAEVESLLG